MNDTDGWLHIDNATLVGIPDQHWGEVVAAMILPMAGTDVPGADEMHRCVRTTLAPHKGPSRWYRTESFPANAMGKLQKSFLRKQIQNAELPALDSGNEVSGS